MQDRHCIARVPEVGAYSNQVQDMLPYVPYHIRVVGQFLTGVPPLQVLIQPFGRRRHGKPFASSTPRSHGLNTHVKQVLSRHFEVLPDNS